MGKKLWKVQVFVVFALMIQMIVVPFKFSAEELNSTSTSTSFWTVPINYLALGDSLAAGVTSNSELGKGYTDFIAEFLHAVGALKSYNKGFSFPKYTTEDVLKDIQANVKKDVYGMGYEESQVELQQSIENAGIITISAGANDVLPLVQIDPTTGAVTVDQLKISAAIQQVAINYKTIMAQIYELNPDAQVYVMGYYNPFPYLSAEIQPMLNQLLKTLNGSIVASLEGTKAVFVPTAHIIAEDYKAYLPNPNNIHLSESGYDKVAEQFLLSMQAINEPSKASFADIAGHGLESYIEQAATAGIIGGYEDGTFKPEENLTRAQAASIIVRTLGLKTDEAAPFTDIANYANHTKADINAAYKYGIVLGDSGKFKPTETVTRAQLALMIERAYRVASGKVYKAENVAPYSDFGNYNAEVVNAISMLYEFEVATGYDGKFMPNNPTTRAQAAKMFVNFLSVFQKVE